jgi:hypothetical protein
MIFGWLYVSYGSLPQMEWLLYGVKPVMVAIIAQAVWELGKRAVKGPLTLSVGLIALLLYALGVAEIPVVRGRRASHADPESIALRWRGSTSAAISLGGRLQPHRTVVARRLVTRSYSGVSSRSARCYTAAAMCSLRSCNLSLCRI